MGSVSQKLAETALQIGIDWEIDVYSLECHDGRPSCTCFLV